MRLIMNGLTALSLLALPVAGCKKAEPAPEANKTAEAPKADGEAKS